MSDLELDTFNKKDRSNAAPCWKYATKFETQINTNSIEIRVEKWKCKFGGCNQERIFHNTTQVTNHLRSHGILFGDGREQVLNDDGE